MTVSLRVAIVGYGAIAEVHVKALRESNASPELVVGPSLEGVRAFAERHVIPYSSTNVDDAWSSQTIDAVVVASPNAMHESQALAAVEAGKHVLCEVPLALSGAGAERLAAISTDRVLMVAHTQRYWSPALELRRRIAEGLITPLHASIRYLLRRRENVGWTGRVRSWTDSVLWHHGAHAVDAGLWLLRSPVQRLSATAGRTSAVPGGLMDISIAARLISGTLASVTLSYNSKWAVSDITLIAEEDTYLVSDAALKDSAGNTLISDPDMQQMQWRAVCRQDEAFVRAASGGTPSPVSAHDVLPTYQALGVVEGLVANDIASTETEGTT